MVYSSMCCRMREKRWRKAGYDFDCCECAVIWCLGAWQVQLPYISYYVLGQPLTSVRYNSKLVLITRYWIVLRKCNKGIDWTCSFRKLKPIKVLARPPRSLRLAQRRVLVARCPSIKWGINRPYYPHYILRHSLLRNHGALPPLPSQRPLQHHNQH